MNNLWLYFLLFGTGIFLLLLGLNFILKKLNWLLGPTTTKVGIGFCLLMIGLSIVFFFGAIQFKFYLPGYRATSFFWIATGLCVALLASFTDRKLYHSIIMPFGAFALLLSAILAWEVKVDSHNQLWYQDENYRIADTHILGPTTLEVIVNHGIYEKGYQLNLDDCFGLHKDLFEAVYIEFGDTDFTVDLFFTTTVGDCGNHFQQTIRF